MNRDFDANWQPGGHAEQLRNRLWGREEPTAATLQSLGGNILPVTDFDLRFAAPLDQTEVESSSAESSDTESSRGTASSGKYLIHGN